MLAVAQAEYERTGRKQRLCAFFEYQADLWERPRTVIAKAECQAAGSKLRFAVTSLPVCSDDHARRRYDDYIQPGGARLTEMDSG